MNDLPASEGSHPSFPATKSGEPNAEDRRAAADALARQKPLLCNSVCLDCRSHRTVISGKGSVFLLCESKRTPANWPKYPPQPLLRCPYLERTGEQPTEIPLE